MAQSKSKTPRKRKATAPPGPPSLSASTASIECDLALYKKLHRAPVEATAPEATVNGIEGHATIAADLKAHLSTHENVWGKKISLDKLYPPDGQPYEVEQDGYFDFDMGDGSTVRVNLIIDLAYNGVLIDHKSAYDEFSDTPGRKFQRQLYAYYLLTHRQDLLDDSGGVNVSTHFLRHGSLKKNERYTQADLPTLEARIRERFAHCLSIWSLPEPPRPSPGFCEFCSYPLSCPVQDIAKTIATREGYVEAVKELKKRQAAANAVLRLCKQAAQQYGEADLGDGERWGKRASQSVRVDPDALFRHGCACQEAHCLPWVRRAFRPDTDEVKRLAKTDEAISSMAEMVEGSTRWGFYKAEKQETDNG